MAAKKLDSSNTTEQEELGDITTCCICTEVCTDPKALPCIHTFCMKCIQETGLRRDKRPGDEMPCPICRRLFKIPAEGFPGLPRHFFIERLVKVAKLADTSTRTKVLCSSCLEESKEQDRKETPTAVTNCVVCNKMLCKECCIEHGKFKLTKNHKLMPITEYESFENAMTNLVPMVCEVHEQKVLDVYCADCKTVVCAICFIEAHDNHKGFHVDKCLDGFRKKIERNAEAVNGCIIKAQTKKADIMKMKEEMHQMVENLERFVDKRKEEIKQFADKRARCLLEGLCSERESRFKDIKMATDETDEYISNLESYNSYCQRILANGSASDICSALCDLSVRALELQKACQPVIEREIPDFRFPISQSELEELLDEDCGDLVGEIHEEGNLKAASKKRSKENLGLFAELSNENDLLRKEIQIGRAERENLQSAIEQERINAKREVQTLTEELIKEQTKYTAHVGFSKSHARSLRDKEIISNALQVQNDKLKQELQTEKTTSNLLQLSNNKLVEEWDRRNATLKAANVVEPTKGLKILQQEIQVEPEETERKRSRLRKVIMEMTPQHATGYNNNDDYDAKLFAMLM